ncbi:MAG TPA: hypothetical protein VM581_04820, partial [Magnetospirillaceae bacterium]|nr:hypothetical protein [Magnetospirillaceae bacterium]
TGDPNELNFLGADGGNSQADEQKIVLSARHRNSIVKASITLLNQQLDKQQLISELNRYVGESVATLFRSDIDLSLVG